MSNTGGAAPGWYPDPYDPRQLRYFDGQSWTESVTAAPAAAPEDQPGYGQSAVGQPGPGQPGPPADGPPGYGPPSYGQPDYGRPSPGQPVYGRSGYGQPPSYGGPLGDIGEWLSATFSGLFSRILPMSILLYFVPVIGIVIVIVLMSSGFSNVRYNSLTDEFSGFSPAAFVGAAVALVVVALVSLLCWLAANHQMYAFHSGQPAEFDASLRVAVRRLPRTIGWGLLGTLVWVAGLGVAIGLPVALAVTAGNGGVIALVVLLMFALAGVAIFVIIRMRFVGQAMAIGPSGTNPFAASWKLTQDRFWGVFGRVLLLGVINWLIQAAFQIMFQVVFAATALTSFETDPATGELVVDGERFGTADQVIGDLIPSIPILVILTALSVVSYSTTTALTVSGYTWLYNRGGGPGEV